jgi:hypothetical protein
MSSDCEGGDTESLDTALTLVVVASAGNARLDFALPRVSCNEGDRFVLAFADCLMEETTSEAVLPAEEMLSFATCVIGLAFFLGQVLSYQL